MRVAKEIDVLLHDLKKAPGDHVCCFCRKTRREVLKLIAANGHAICNECIGQCVKLLEKEP